tara:strand:+ start:1553 stop:1993 length:441 start_codon:yes stop_codon:yes gene_type:complete
MDDVDWKLGHCKDDPVRPHLPLAWRAQKGREVWGLEREDGAIDAVICVAYTNEVPITEHELDVYSQAACQDGEHGNIAVFYTVWSYARGAGRTMVLEAAREIKRSRPVRRFVTLSPLTEMAERFHLRNGARLVARGTECQNFEYDL